MTKPKRIQRRRTKGWRLPPNTVTVTRPGVFGNPFTIDTLRSAGFQGSDEALLDIVVQMHRDWLTKGLYGAPEARARVLAMLPGLRGMNLACFCPIMEDDRYVQCHADILLSLANDMTLDEVRNENLRWAKGEAL